MSQPNIGHPFAVNFKKLQQYNFSVFSLEEIVFFEYIIILAKTFGYKEFYHSTSTITKDTGIKRAKLEKIIQKFADHTFIAVEVKGFPLVKYFRVNIPFICENLHHIYQFEGNSKLHAETCKLYAEISKQYVETNTQEKLIQETNRETKKATKDLKREEMAAVKKFDFNYIEAVNYIHKLEKDFNLRRQRGKDAKKYPPVTLGHKNKSSYVKMQEAMNELGTEVIDNAWMVYVDQMMDKIITPTKILPYFLSKKDSEYDVIGNMADFANSNYVYTGK